MLLSTLESAKGMLKTDHYYIISSCKQWDTLTGSMEWCTEVINYSSTEYKISLSCRKYIKVQLSPKNKVFEKNFYFLKPTSKGNAPATQGITTQPQTGRSTHASWRLTWEGVDNDSFHWVSDTLKSKMLHTDASKEKMMSPTFQHFITLTAPKAGSRIIES